MTEHTATTEYSYTPKEAGKLSVNVNVDGKAVGESPYEVEVAGLTASGANSRARGPGLTAAVRGEKAEYTVIACTDVGLATNSSAGVDVKGRLVASADDSSVDVDVVDNNDGTFLCTYVPKQSGKHLLETTLNGEAIEKSPFQVICSISTFSFFF